MIASPLSALAMLASLAVPPPAPVTPSSVLSAAPAADWRPLDPAELLVMDLRGGARVVLALAPAFAPVHVANIVAMARAGYYDGLWIERVQDNYVVQWGDPDGKKPLPRGIVAAVPAEYERDARGLAFRPLPYRDVFAPMVGFASGWPVAEDGGRAWLTHCYGMVGVGRDNAPDTGTGAELYTVIGQSPRALDRNIALVGRIVSGMEALTALPRGTGDLGFYKTLPERLPIEHVHLAADLPPGERPRIEMLGSDSASFAAWVKARANRKDAFYVRPAGAVDVCGVLPPARERPR